MSETHAQAMARMRRRDFICRCGWSLFYEHKDGQVRVACSAMTLHPKEIHDEPTAWCESREASDQLWRVTAIMQGQ
jgi:hypothetical protein